MPDISHLLDTAAPRVVSVPVCLDGTAAERLAELQAEHAELADWEPGSLGDTDPRVDLARQVERAREELAAATVEFRLQALGHLAFTRLLGAHPPAPGKNDLYDPDTLLPALLAACCISPTLSPAQVSQLLDRVNHGTAQALFGAVLAVNEEPSPLPF
jgi:hypothetical protein